MSTAPISSVCPPAPEIGAIFFTMDRGHSVRAKTGRQHESCRIVAIGSRWAPSDGIDFRRDRKNYSRRCEAHQMTAWKTMESAPKDGTEILLVARFQIYGGDGTISRVVGAWNEHVQQWRLSPEFLDNGEYLIPSHWAQIPELPSGA